MKIKEEEKINEKNMSMLDKLVELGNNIKSLDQKMFIKFKERKIVESELFAQVQDNRDLLDYCRGESQITIIQPKYNLQNCKSTKDESKSSCAIFRSKNIVYLTIVFEGKIEEKNDVGRAEITLEMPIWKILSGTFKVESIQHCLSKENSINKLSVKLNQKGNKMILCLNKSEFNIQTYWEKDDKAKFTIRGNFLIDPTPVRATGNFFVYNIATNKVIGINNNELILANDWEKGSLFEIYKENTEMKIKANNKYLNINGGKVKLERNKNAEIEVSYMPGFTDIIYIILYQDKRELYLSSEENGNNLILENEPTTKCQFLIIPEIN